jgi:integrase
MFTDWLKNYVNLIVNQGTKIRYVNILNLLVDISNNKYKRDFIFCREIDKTFVMEFQKWLITERKNNINTVQYKLKAFKALINHCIKDGFFNYPIHPFQNINFKKTNRINDVLTLEELKKIMEMDFREVYRRVGKKGLDFDPKRPKNNRYKPKHSLNEIRNYFLFQVFAQGLRLSDILTLRWNNFYLSDNDLMIRKKMVKTQIDIEIVVNDKALGILSQQLNEELNEEFDCYYKCQLETKDPIEDILDMTFEESKTGMFYYKLDKKNMSKLQAAFIKELRTKNLPIHPTLEKKMKPYIDFCQKQRNKHLNKEYKKILKHTKIMVLENSKSKPLDFVFPILNSEDFYQLNKEDDFYSMDENYHRKFQSARTYYNKALKLIAQQAEINKNLTSHVARHSYSSLLLELGESINLFDIMTSLGHTRLNTTQTYLKTISNKKLLNISKIISSKF